MTMQSTFMIATVMVAVSITGNMAVAQSSEKASIPAADVTADNWYWGPANRWSWHNTRRIFPTARVGRGSGAIVPLDYASHDLSKISFDDPVSNHPMTVAEMLERTYTDGFIVLHQGRIIAESYRGGMTADDPHMLMSVSKSVVGTLAGILVDEGKLDPKHPVTQYLPELAGTIYDGATIRQLIDMTVSDPVTEAPTADPYKGIDEAAGWLPPTPSSAPGLRAYLTGLRHAHGAHGQRFLYLDPSTTAIGWAMERTTGQDFAALLSEKIWSKLGAEHDAYVMLDHHQQAFASAGINATLRDLARFGQMMAENGRFNGQQIVPAAWVNDILLNGSDGDRGPKISEKLPGYEDGSYRSFWWLSGDRCGRYAGLGLGGQMLVVDPIAQMVVVKFDSVPTPEATDPAFQTQYRAIDAIIRAIAGHGC